MQELRACFCLSVLYQILCNLLAVDGINDPDVLAINGGKKDSLFRKGCKIFFVYVCVNSL